MIDFAELTFGLDDAKTKFLKEFSPSVEPIVSFRNAVEHPGGYSGTLKIRNFRLEPDGKISEPTWWIEQDGKNTPESSIRGDLCAISESLLTLAEDIFVSWAAENLHFPQFSRIGFVPEEERDPAQPVKYVVTGTAELEKKREP